MMPRLLGRKPKAHDGRDLKLARYIDKQRMAEEIESLSPAASSWLRMRTPDGGLPVPDTDVLGNDVLGNCVFAAPGHMINLMGQLVGDPSLLVDRSAASRAYLDATGGVDEGFVIREMLKIWQQAGLYGTKILAYCHVDEDPDEIAIASWLGGGTIVGLSLPLTAQGQVDAQGRALWDVPGEGWTLSNGPGTWGGHAVYSQVTSPQLEGGNSWGEQIAWTGDFRRSCVDERWLVLVDRFHDAFNRSPNGFSLGDLLADVQARAEL
jgi:hypothetical protein